MEVVAVKFGKWMPVRRVELEHNECSDADFHHALEAQKDDRRRSVFGSRIWLDRRVVCTVSREQIQKARKERV